MTAYPHLLIVDHTRIGSLSATGQVKSRLFRGWPPRHIRQIYRASDQFAVCDGDGRRIGGRVSREEAIEKARRYDPDLVYVRPTDQPPHFFELIEELVTSLGSVPMAVHIMDDWMSRAELSPNGAAINERLAALVRKATTCFSISEEMSIALWQRYGIRSRPFANVVEPHEVLAGKSHERVQSDVVRVRYSGGLADDMTSASVARVVEVVGAAQTETPVLLELSILPQWLDRARSLFSDATNVSVVAAENSEHDYRRWLSEADINLLAYNFDEPSLSYIRYSMANKLPDYLAAGQPILAYGPASLPTIRAARESGAALVVGREDTSLLGQSLASLVDNPERRNAMGQNASHAAQTWLNGPATRTEFHRDLVALTGRDTQSISYMRGARASVTKRPKIPQVTFKKSLSRIGHVYGKYGGESLAEILKMVAAAFKGRFGLPLVGAAIAFLVTVVGSVGGWSGGQLSFWFGAGGLLLVLAVAGNVARMRRERRGYGRQLEESTRDSMNRTATALEEDLRTLAEAQAETLDRMERLQARLDRLDGRRRG